jgi:hypothetical protein
MNQEFVNKKRTALIQIFLSNERYYDENYEKCGLSTLDN